MKSERHSLEDFDIVRALTDDERARLEAHLTLETIPGGQRLISEGEPAETLYIVVSGRFAVTRNGGLLAQIGRGEPVGEVAFFTGGTRTADVTAMRDSDVYSITRTDFDALANQFPKMWRSVVGALARRLEGATASQTTPATPVKPRTVVICPAGNGDLPDGLASKLTDAIGLLGAKVRLLDEDTTLSETENAPLESTQMNDWLASQEATHQLLLLPVSAEVNDWTRKIVRQADAAVLVGCGDPEHRNPAERLLAERLRPEEIRIATLSGKTSDWTAIRNVSAHHRVNDDNGIAALARFVTGRARGLVLGGGGALCGAHVGVAFALREAGVDFESFAGTSAGGAVGAAMAMNLPRAEIIERCKDIFLTNKSLKRWTIPRHGLVDPAVADRMVKHHYGLGRVEDLPNPFFCIATDLSDSKAHVIDRGPVWEAVRATCSIPMLLPPMIDEDGRILVDGGILDNLPVDRMRARKRGPNVAVMLGASRWRRADFKYSDYPNRRALMIEKLTPWKKRKRLKAPRMGQILTRSILLASDNEAQDALNRADMVFQPPLPKGMGIMDWHRFEQHERDTFDWARAEIERRLADDPDVLTEFL